MGRWKTAIINGAVAVMTLGFTGAAAASAFTPPPVLPASATFYHGSPVPATFYHG